MLITSFKCLGFTQTIVQFDKSIFYIGCESPVRWLDYWKTGVALIADWKEVVFYFGELFGVFGIQETVSAY